MDRLEIIETLKHFPDALEQELKVPEAVLRFKPAEEEWSAKEVIGHAVYLDGLWYRRLYSVWSMQDPVLTAFDDAAQQALQGRVTAASDLKSYFADLRTSRLQIVDLLSNAVDWTRVGQWKGVGRRSLKQLAEHLVSHDADHIAQVRALKAAAQASSAR